MIVKIFRLDGIRGDVERARACRRRVKSVVNKLSGLVGGGVENDRPEKTSAPCETSFSPALLPAAMRDLLFSHPFVALSLQ